MVVVVILLMSGGTAFCVAPWAHVAVAESN